MIVSTDMPAWFCRLCYRAQSLESLERNILTFTGIDPAHRHCALPSRRPGQGQIHAADHEIRIAGCRCYGVFRIGAAIPFTRMPTLSLEGEMQPCDETEARRTTASVLPRKVVHDLRNLFAIIAAAKSLLERDPDAARGAELLQALGEAARAGAQLTTNLLANRDDQSPWRVIDLDERLLRLAPILRVLAKVSIRLARGNRYGRIAVCTVPAELDAALIELVSNAARAGATEMTIRGRKCGGHIWLILADNGCGMSEPTLERARRGRDLGLAHGSGLSRVQQFVSTCCGTARIRSRLGHGTTIALVLPAIDGEVVRGAECSPSRQLIAA